MKKNSQKDTDAIADFLRNLDGALGERLVGAILFGSRSKGNAGADSDIDLAVIVADVDRERSRQEAFRVLGASGIDLRNIALSVESYMRLKEFLNLGDPFAWTVCGEGHILKDRNELLKELQQKCGSSAEKLDSQAVAQYLKGKSTNHYVQAMQALNQFYSNVQLSVMAGAQAVATHQSKKGVLPDNLMKMAEWQQLKGVLQEAGATRREIETVEQLIMAHKQAHKADQVADDFPGKELLARIRDVGELWKRLLPAETERK